MLDASSSNGETISFCSRRDLAASSETRQFRMIDQRPRPMEVGIGEPFRRRSRGNSPISECIILPPLMMDGVSPSSLCTRKPRSGLLPACGDVEGLLLSKEAVANACANRSLLPSSNQCMASTPASHPRRHEPLSASRENRVARSLLGRRLRGRNVAILTSSCLLQHLLDDLPRSRSCSVPLSSPTLLTSHELFGCQL